MKKGSAPSEAAITVLLDEKTFTATTAGKLGYSKTKGLIVLNILNQNEEDARFVVRMG